MNALVTYDKLVQLERALENRLIELRRATDGAGLKVNVTPQSSAPYDQARFSVIPSPEDFRRKILELFGAVEAKRIEYRGEEALARNVALLAAAWEAAVRYWDFKRELEK